MNKVFCVNVEYSGFDNRKFDSLLAFSKDFEAAQRVIVDQICDEEGLEIEAESTVGSITTFHFDNGTSAEMSEGFAYVYIAGLGAIDVGAIPNLGDYLDGPLSDPIPL